MPQPSNTEIDALFQPLQLGDVALANRIVMAPMTRSRAGEDEVPGPLAVEYYAQRASAGLIITEATQVSETAQGYPYTPGLYTDAQQAGWRPIVEAVHARGGRIFVQLWHTGRVSHTRYQPEGRAPMAPSATHPEDVFTFIPGEGKARVSAARAMTAEDIAGVIEDYRGAARRARLAGFDGVEVHGANGYLLDQFLRDSVNRRSDAYGGGIAQRARLLLDVVQAVADEIGPGRTGVRLSPVSPYNGLSDSDPQALFEHVAARLDGVGVAYLHVVEGATGGARDYLPFDYAALRARYRGAWIVNNSYERDSAARVVAQGEAQLVSFGRAFLFNPDLPRRLREGAALNEKFPDAMIYGGGGAHGYTDYPTLDDIAASA